MDAQQRREILDMLAQGKISAAEAAEMLEGRTGAAPADVDALKASEANDFDPDMIKVDVADEPQPVKEKAPAPLPPMDSNGGKPHWLRIRVRDMETGRNKVSVNLPLGLVTFGLGVARRFGADMGEVNPDELLEAMKHGERGLLVDVEDEEDGEHVQIYLD